MAVAPQLVTPVCTVSPAGGGTITFTPIQSAAEYQWLNEDAEATGGEYTSYRYEATPNFGWQFVDLNITVTSYWDTPTVGPFTRVSSKSVFVPIYEATPGTTLSDFVNTRDNGGYAYWLTRSNRSYYPPYQELYTTTAISVKATFRQVRVPTHLLVNSANVVAPVLLVHDPTTGLLVADY